jgi:hypothetical protein
MQWRVIITDSESLTGVAPVCESTHEGDGADYWVYDCCPYPQIETYSEDGARRVAAILTELEAGMCS